MLAKKQIAPKRKLRLKVGRGAASPEVRPWPVLVVDDDADVHEMTRVILRDFQFQGQPFEILSASSAAEAETLLAERPDIPVALVDVVMETPHAGLELVRRLREEMGNRTLRIILRTGQPGEAPEHEVVSAYDINDYRSKAELTAQKLLTALMGALRSWKDIKALERLNATLEEKVADRTRVLNESLRFTRELVEMIPNPVWFKDAEGRYRLCNRAFRELFSVGETEWEGRTVSDLPCGDLAAEDTATDASLLANPSHRSEFETGMTCADRETRTVLVAKNLLDGARGTPVGIIGVLTDITERKAMERELARLATTDPLTGANNRRRFLEMATQELERARRYGRPLSVVMLDVDHFKRINDTHGHAVGDEVLKAAVATMRHALRDVDVVGRYGGEEFTVLLPETALDSAHEAAERLRIALARRVIGTANGPVRLTASIGVAEMGPDDTIVDQLLARADDALYRAKEEGRNCVRLDGGEPSFSTAAHSTAATRLN